MLRNIPLSLRLPSGVPGRQFEEGGRPFSHEGEFEVSDNLVDNFVIFYERDD